MHKLQPCHTELSLKSLQMGLAKVRSGMHNGRMSLTTNDFNPYGEADRCNRISGG